MKAKVDPIVTLVDPIPTEEGCPDPPEVLIKRYRRVFLGPEMGRSKIYEVDLERLGVCILFCMTLG